MNIVVWVWCMTNGMQLNVNAAKLKIHYSDVCVYSYTFTVFVFLQILFEYKVVNVSVIAWNIYNFIAYGMEI